MATHTYTTTLEWAGSTASGYRAYDRTHHVTVAGPSPLILSADAAFRGDADLPNPEQLLVAAVSSCQLLSFLAVAALAGVDVVRYTDRADAIMPDRAAGMRLTEITLEVRVTVRGTAAEEVHRLIAAAHDQCYIANTLATPVTVRAEVEVAA